MQDLTGSPLICRVNAPDWSILHSNFVPVMPSRSRKAVIGHVRRSIELSQPSINGC